MNGIVGANASGGTANKRTCKQLTSLSSGAACLLFFYSRYGESAKILIVSLVNTTKVRMLWEKPSMPNGNKNLAVRYIAAIDYWYANLTGSRTVLIQDFKTSDTRFFVGFWLMLHFYKVAGSQTQKFQQKKTICPFFFK